MFEQFTGNPPRWQKVLNSLPARARPDRKKIPVRARVVWERDGEEWLDGNALRLDPGIAIFVELSGQPRCKFTGVWLDPKDVWWESKVTAYAQADQR